MHFESRFTVAGAPQAVVQKFGNVPLMAGFLPGASVEPPNGEGVYPAMLVASFGPKKIAFTGTLTNSVDREALTGVLAGKASADVRGTRMAVTMHYHLAPAGDGSTTEVRLDSEAQLTGVLAEFAKAGGVIVAEALIGEFARRFSAHMQEAAAGDGPKPVVAASGSQPVPRNEATLTLTTLLLVMVRRFKHWAGLKA